MMNEMMTDLPFDGKTAEAARRYRNELLSRCDDKVWPDHVPDAWRIYRQALRDVPAQSGFPTNITWPREPS
tara:strand:+ start:99 stop:311 length:213 start_codon:yes stop_codon:yes gene_type:complete